ncbi:uncharacterized protein LOC130942243 [Arachis stenosperma]|uniref:uncharacterized protein LOC130942243 n=1 Tax=Arachis stenosperma TaxID=217475 RepID=UPI0025ABCB35|nr:uncharacterized protein LOC130942243 [Arachis stenosperma]
MWCLQLHYSSLLPWNSKLKPYHQKLQHTTSLLRLYSVPQLKNNQHFLLRRKPNNNMALPHYIVVAAATSPPPEPVDMSVFLPVSALLLSFYLITNFLVPDLITKYFGFDETNKDEEEDEDKDNN